jgi:hypothetical protein
VATPVGKTRTNLTISTVTHEWLKQHAVGQRGVGVLIDQLVMKERFSQTLEDRVKALELAVAKLQQRQA